MFESISLVLLGALLAISGVAYGFRKATEAFRISDRLREQRR